MEVPIAMWGQISTKYQLPITCHHLPPPATTSTMPAPKKAGSRQPAAISQKQRSSSHFQHHDRLIVKHGSAFGEIVGGLEQRVGDFLGVLFGILHHHMFDADAAELFVPGFAGVNDAVAEECEYVPALALHPALLVRAASTPPHPPPPASHPA